MEAAHAEREKIDAAKRALAVEMQQADEENQRAKAEAKAAEEEVKKAKALLKKKNQQAEKARKDALADIEKSKAEARKREAEAKAQREKDQKAAAKAKAEREAAAAAARAAAKKAHQLQLAARKKRDEQMAAEHKKKLEAKKAAFEKLFKNVWTTGTTGTSRVQVSSPTFPQTDKVIHEWFADTMAAEVSFVEHVPREYRLITLHPETNNTIDRLMTDKENTAISAITTDERVAEMIETAVEHSGDENIKFLVNPWQTAGPDYIAWVVNQTVEADQSNALYNVDPFANSTPVAHEDVAKLDDYHDPPALL